MSVTDFNKTFCWVTQHYNNMLLLWPWAFNDAETRHDRTLSTCGLDHSQIELKELLGEPGELFGHMAPSAPSKAPVVLYVAAIMAPPGAIPHLAISNIAPWGATNGSPTWARLITEQWLLLRSQNGSFTFMCVSNISLIPSILGVACLCSCQFWIAGLGMWSSLSSSSSSFKDLGQQVVLDRTLKNFMY